MFSLNLRKTNALFWAAVTMALALCQPTDASQALRAMAEANNAKYREIKNLGVKPNAVEVDAIHQKNFGPANQLLDQEHRAHIAKWKGYIKQVMVYSKEKMIQVFGLDGKSKPLAASKEAPLSPSTSNINRAPASYAPAPVRNTGDVQGSGSAQKVDLTGAKREQNAAQPKVVDGIIMER